MNAEKVIASYLRVAAEDLEGAVQLAKTGNRNAIYLCSQAAEKAIRAVLTSEGIHAGTGHQLDRMVAMIPDENPIKSLLSALDALGDYATSFRYPSVAGRIKKAPSFAEFERFAGDVDKAIHEVANRLGVDLENSDGSASHPEPIR